MRIKLFNYLKNLWHRFWHENPYQ